MQCDFSTEHGQVPSGSYGVQQLVIVLMAVGYFIVASFGDHVFAYSYVVTLIGHL